MPYVKLIIIIIESIRFFMGISLLTWGYLPCSLSIKIYYGIIDYIN